MQQTTSMTRQSAAAAALTLLAVILMIVSAVLFKPAEHWTNPPIFQAIGVALLGGAALLLAMRRSPYTVPVARVSDVPMTGEGIRWVLLIPGLLLLAFGTEIGTNILKTDSLPLLAPHVQFVVLFGGFALFTLGMIGVRRLSLPHIRRTDALPVLAILILAFAVRADRLDSLYRGSLDEGHFLWAVYALYPIDNAHNSLLTDNVLDSPVTMIYPYFNLMTTMIWGANFVGLRMLDAILGTLTVLVIYHMGRTLFNRRIGLLAALILATFPPFVFYSRVSIATVADTFFGFLAILFAARGFRWNRRQDWILMGVSLGMAQFFYEGGRLLFPIVFVSWIILMALLSRGKFKPLRRGLVLSVITTIIVITPMYFTMWSTQRVLTSRLNNGSIIEPFLGGILRGDLTSDQLVQYGNNFLDAFLPYVFSLHGSQMDMYGGKEPLVLRVFVPLFLLGFFYAFWHFRTPLSLSLLVLGWASLGNFFLGDPHVYGRFIETMPNIALLMAVGLGCTLPMLNPFASAAVGEQPSGSAPKRRWRMSSSLVAFGLAGVICVVQLIYFYDHLMPEFNYSARAGSPNGDLFEAAERFAQRPNAAHEQILFYDTGMGGANGANEFLSYSLGRRDYDGEFHLSSTITRETLRDLPRDRTYVFFVRSDDQRIMQLLNESFTLEPPTYSLDFNNPLVRTMYLMFVAPHEKNMQVRQPQTS